MKGAYLALLVAMNCLWAVSYPAFKVLAAWLDPGAVATLRFGLAGTLLLLLWPLLPGPNPRGADILRILLISVTVFVFAPRLQIAGVQLGKAADASILVALDPLVVSIAAALVLRETIAPRRWIGFALGMAGIAIMQHLWRPEGRLRAWPSLLVLASFSCEAAYSILGKPMMARVGAFKVLAFALASATVLNFLLDGKATLRQAATLPPAGWAILLYLAIVCTVIGYALWLVVIRHTEINAAALTVFVQPVVGVAISLIWLHESLDWNHLWGSATILVGLAYALMPIFGGMTIAPAPKQLKNGTVNISPTK